MTPRQQAGAAALAALTDLEVEEAQLFARKQQALVDAYTCFDHAPGSGRGSVEFVALEIAIACGIAQSTATARLSRALHLVEQLPGTLRLLREGSLTVGQALVLVEETAGLPSETCAALEATVLPELPELTTGDSRRRVKKALLALDVAASEERRRQRARERKAFLSPKPDGRSFVGIEGSAEDGSRFFAELTALCTLTFGTGDARTLDQQRSDLALQLSGFALASRRGHGPSLRTFLGLPDEGAVACSLSARNALTPAQQRRVQGVVLVPVETGLGMSDSPAELVGYGPISGPHARELLAAAELRHATTDLTTGRLLSLGETRLRPERGWFWGSTVLPPADRVVEVVGGHGPPLMAPPVTAPPRRTGQAPAPPGPLSVLEALLAMVHSSQPALPPAESRHDPSPGLGDLLRFRDTRCIGPGCSLPATACDLEHWEPYPTGTTSAFNVGPASRRCHDAKTYGGWSYTPHPDGSVTWSSPFGTTYVRRPRTSGHDLSDLHTPVREAPPHQRPPET